MTSVLDRDALDKSPLADLHLIANELGVDGFRRLRKAELVDAIIARQSGEEAPAAAVEEAPKPPRRRSRAKTEPVADFLRVRAALRGDLELEPHEGITPDRYPGPR